MSTTEDPLDDLEIHKALRKVPFVSSRRSAPTRRCFWTAFISRILENSQRSGRPYSRLLLYRCTGNLAYFKEVTGTTVSDDGIPHFRWVDATGEEIDVIFKKAMAGEALSETDIDKYQSAFLFEMGRRYCRHGYVMQLHIGTYLDANTKKVAEIGQSTGFDCTDDSSSVRSVGELLNKLTLIGELPKTILYPLDSSKMETWAVLAAGFCDGETKAKVQLGAPWWFNDQYAGIKQMFESCSNLYPLALYVGMLTDSRSFLSYPRHELYRRLLCNYLGELVERGEYFSSESYLKEIIEDVCFHNANEFFGFNVQR